MDANAARDARDLAKLGHVVAADEAFDRALKLADDASRTGDDARAAKLLETEVTRAGDDALAAATRETLETPWAAARRDSIVAVMRARRDSIPPYAKALRGEDVAAKLAALQTQLELQKWAIDAAKAALAPPGPAPDAG
jgi:hypothetical protein